MELSHNCHTQLHLGFSANLRIWQVSACKMEPQRSINFIWEPPSMLVTSTEPRKLKWGMKMIQKVWVKCSVNIWPGGIYPCQLYHTTWNSSSAWIIERLASWATKWIYILIETAGRPPCHPTTRMLGMAWKLSGRVSGVCIDAVSNFLLGVCRHKYSV